MRDNCADPGEGPSLRYSSFDVLALRGSDALSFAQAQLASDVYALEDRGWQWTAWLTPQGRVVALMVLVRHSADALDLLVPAERGSDVAARLQRFVFRAKVALAVNAGVRAGAQAHAPAGRGAAIDGDPGDYGVWLSESLLLRAAASPPAGDEAALRAHLVDAGLPLLAGASAEAHTAHALGLDAIGAISTRKGCYPGQEIVARMHFLGRNKRHLCRFAIAEPATEPAPGAAIETGDGAGAEVVLALNEADGTVRGLAVAHEQALTGEASFRLEGRAVSLVRARRAG